MMTRADEVLRDPVDYPIVEALEGEIGRDVAHDLVFGEKCIVLQPAYKEAGFDGMTSIHIAHRCFDGSEDNGSNPGLEWFLVGGVGGL